jgi:diphthine synthase
VALHLVGLGLHDVRDVTVKGLERIRSCAKVYAEFYTAMLAGTSPEELQRFLGKPVTVLDRLGVEKGAVRLVEEARTQDVALLTAGDPLTATTHADLMVRCHAAGVAFHVVHAPSIYSAAPGLLGLQHYKFGRTTTLVRPEKGWSPTSPFDAVAENHARGLHTLVLLDIKVGEARGLRRPDGGPTGPPDADERYYMRAGEGISLLLDLAVRAEQPWFNADTQVGVVARAGSDGPQRVTGRAGDLARLDFGPPLHCVVVPGNLHVVEQEAWAMFQRSAGSS